MCRGRQCQTSLLAHGRETRGAETKKDHPVKKIPLRKGYQEGLGQGLRIRKQGGGRDQRKIHHDPKKAWPTKPAYGLTDMETDQRVWFRQHLTW